MLEKFPMTKEGYEQLLNERNHLKDDVLPKILTEVQIAREHGDLSENAEYKFGKEAQRNTERKIGEIAYKLINAEIIDIKTIPENDVVIFGSTVTFINLSINEKITYKIVGEDEADLSKGKISYLAPVAKNAIGKEPGDVIKISTDQGIIEYEIDDVEYI
jgi:transcription elongation factor GreA